MSDCHWRGLLLIVVITSASRSTSCRRNRQTLSGRCCPRSLNSGLVQPHAMNRTALVSFWVRHPRRSVVHWVVVLLFQRNSMIGLLGPASSGWQVTGADFSRLRRLSVLCHNGARPFPSPSVHTILPGRVSCCTESLRAERERERWPPP